MCNAKITPKTLAPLEPSVSKKCMFWKQELLEEVCFHIIIDTLETIMKHNLRNSKLCTMNTFAMLIKKDEKKKEATR